MEPKGFIPFKSTHPIQEKEMVEKSLNFYTFSDRRRTVRSFSDKEIPEEVIKNCIRAAGTAPSGANKQPWYFAVIKDKNLKRQVRVAAENEELLFYTKRASKSWLNDLRPLGTNESKPYLEVAPYLIAIFYKTHEATDVEKSKTYYAKESTGIATGLLITALHHCGLVTLTHTPSPMDFLNEVLGLSKNQYKPFLLLVTGYPEKGSVVPDIQRKSFNEIAEIY